MNKIKFRKFTLILFYNQFDQIEKKRKLRISNNKIVRANNEVLIQSIKNKFYRCPKQKITSGIFNTRNCELAWTCTSSLVASFSQFTLLL